MCARCRASLPPLLYLLRCVMRADGTGLPGTVKDQLSGDGSIITVSCDAGSPRLEPRGVVTLKDQPPRPRKALYRPLMSMAGGPARERQPQPEESLHETCERAAAFRRRSRHNASVVIARRGARKVLSGEPLAPERKSAKTFRKLGPERSEATPPRLGRLTRQICRSIFSLCKHHSCAVAECRPPQHPRRPDPDSGAIISARIPTPADKPSARLIERSPSLCGNGLPTGPERRSGGSFDPQHLTTEICSGMPGAFFMPKTDDLSGGTVWLLTVPR